MSEWQTKGFVSVINEAGYWEAVYSISKPYSKTQVGSFAEFMQNADLTLRMDKVAHKLAWKNNGENKFLRMMQVWLDILAPRNWWAHFDTYKIGTTAQSNSLGNKIASKDSGFITLEQCENGTLPEAIAPYNMLLRFYKEQLHHPYLDRIPSKYDVKNNVPEGFMQNRVVNLNYAVLQTMYYQRHVQEKHPFWKVFLGAYKQLQHLPFVVPAEDLEEYA